VLLQDLAIAMTAPSFANFETIVTGWLFARRRTVTRMLLAGGRGRRAAPVGFSSFLRRRGINARRDDRRCQQKVRNSN
jgi:hypothetical protein